MHFFCLGVDTRVHVKHILLRIENVLFVRKGNVSSDCNYVNVCMVVCLIVCVHIMVSAFYYHVACWCVFAFLHQRVVWALLAFCGTVTSFTAFSPFTLVLFLSVLKCLFHK